MAIPPLIMDTIAGGERATPRPPGKRGKVRHWLAMRMREGIAALIGRWDSQIDSGKNADPYALFRKTLIRNYSADSFVPH